MEIIKILIVTAIGAALCGFCVKEAINSFKNEKYFWFGAWATDVVVILSLLVDFVLYQTFIY